jgi:hypothetical protein
MSNVELTETANSPTHFAQNIVFPRQSGLYGETGDSDYPKSTPPRGNSVPQVLKVVVLHQTVYRVSREECKKLRERVPYVKLYRYNPKHVYPKLNGYGDNGQRSLKL